MNQINLAKTKIEKLRDELIKKGMMSPLMDIENKPGDYSYFQLSVENSNKLREILNKYGFYVVGVGHNINVHTMGDIGSAKLKISPEKHGKIHPNFYKQIK